MSDEKTTPKGEAEQTGKSYSEQEYEAAVERSRRFEAQLSDVLKKLGTVKPDDVGALKQSYDELMRERANKGGDKEREDYEQHLKTDYEKRYGSKFEELTKANSELAAQNKELRVVDRVFSQIGHLFNDDCADDVKARIRSSCDLEDGAVVIRGQDGKVRFSAKNPKEKMSIAEFAELVASERPSWAKPTQTGGAKQPGQKLPLANGATKLTLADLKNMADGGKALLSKMSPEDVRALFAK